MVTIPGSIAGRSRLAPRVPYSRTRISGVVAGCTGVAAIIVLTVAWSVWNRDWPARPPAVVGLPVAILAIILGAGAVFSCFTVEVRGETLAWWFGLGAFRHEVMLSAIAEAGLASTSWRELRHISRKREGSGSSRAYGTSGGQSIALKLYDGSSLKLQAQEPEALLMVLRR